jgi:hypothetical protein
MLKPNIIQMLLIAKDMNLDTLEDAYFDYQRHYDLFFSVENFSEQNEKFTQDLINCGLVDNVDGKLCLKDIMIDEAIKVYKEFNSGL